jgi:hypothetical protein
MPNVKGESAPNRITCEILRLRREKERDHFNFAEFAHACDVFSLDVKLEGVCGVYTGFQEGKD